MAPLPAPRHRAPASTAAAVSYTAMVAALAVLTVLLTTCTMVRPAAAAALGSAAVPGAGDSQTTRWRSDVDAAVMNGQGEKDAGNDGIRSSNHDGGVGSHRLRRLGDGGSGGGGGRSGELAGAARVEAAAAAAAAAAIGTKAAASKANPVERLIEGTGSSGSVFHLDLTLLEGGGNSSSTPQELVEGKQLQQQQHPWFEGFAIAAPEANPEAGPAAGGASVKTAAVTIGHPVRRLLSYFVEEGVELEEALSWMSEQGLAADSTIPYRQGYQLVDNYLVRVLGGRAAWELPPGRVGSAELTAARTALGKFEVVLRQDCLSTDLALLAPYLNLDDDSAGSDAYIDVPSFRPGRVARNAAPDKDPDEPAAPPPSLVEEEEEEEEEATPLSLPAGPEGERLVRANRWDLELWDFANELVASRSSTLEGFRCGSSKLAKSQRPLGEGRRAVVFNSPEFHLTGVSTFSCALVANGYRVTAVLRQPVAGYQQLLPCPDEIIILRDPPVDVADTTNNGGNGSTNSNNTASTPSFVPSPIVLSDTVAGMLGLTVPTAQGEEGQEQPAEGGGGGGGGGEVGDKNGGEPGVEVAVGGEGREEQGGTGGEGGGGEGGGNFFDVSVLCTAFVDLNTLFDSAHQGMDPRMADALLWNVNTTIWNVHGVGRAFGNGGVPPSAHDFAARLPSREKERLGETPPPTFLTVYGEHVGRWEESLEEAYEGWGGGARHEPTAPLSATYRRPKVTNLRGVFPPPGVVYPIVPTGQLRLPRQRKQNGGGGLFNIVAPSSSGSSLGDEERPKKRVNFVIQGNMQGVRRNYLGLFGCLEQMCTSTDEGRDDFSLEAVGSRGDMTAVLEAHPCAASRYTEGRDLEYEDFYARIVEGDFVVTAAAGHDYEYDHATSSVPTALLLEKPLVMSSSLLNAYPCLRGSRIHSLVANDDLCLNLQAAYDLTPAEYDEMELEARDCKLQMWRQTQKTVVDIVREGRIQNGGG